ncbi:Tripartite-type tricarboxylate transporter, receptor component TctC [Variovorax sp. HW608]|uniref:Bug family tripartite tricarboxylate transporter substrate binding protein n=1 Tax=Variovorax sp. HW608 TaxID=1034889 RepID=UPI00081FCB71|nr:tripartite tricarboxylate transporter substrate-binding protein [Variovorax sp. HW608]SCK19225.1 Tripartite-type tricarboxylate transporter, receptor component TctC [Variovorax sp. HW608]
MTSIFRRRMLALLAAFALAPRVAPPAHAEGAAAWPSRPVKIIVAYPAGQSTDIATRYFAEKLTHAFGQTFFVENRVGASGNIGTAFAARATPDGYTLLMGASGTHAMNPALYANPGFDAEKDFDPIALTALIPFAISTSSNASVSSMSELIAMAKSKPDKVDAALPSVTAQLVFEMLRQRDVPLYAINFKGSGEAMAAVLGGHVQVLIDTVAATRTQMPRIRPLAVTTATPVVSMPGVKTTAEQGLPNFTIAAWNVLMVPRGVPAEIQSRLAAEMRKILDLPETQKALADLGFERAPSLAGNELASWLREERRNYASVIQAAHMRAE